jgi:hypothetical protein
MSALLPTGSASPYTPSAVVTVRASISEYDIPLALLARVSAEVRYPDGTVKVFAISSVDEGVYETSWVAGITGVYTVEW